MNDTSATAAERDVAITPTDATADPHNGKPVFADPDFTDRIEHAPCGISGEEYEPDQEAAGWDLSGGARINYGPIEDGGPLYVTLHVSDYAQATGFVRRVVTGEQLVAHAEHLLRIAGAQHAHVLPEVTP